MLSLKLIVLKITAFENQLTTKFPSCRSWQILSGRVDVGYSGLFFSLPTGSSLSDHIVFKFRESE